MLTPKVFPEGLTHFINMANVLRTAFIFLLAALCEIGGGYLIWLWLKEHKPAWYGLIGALILVSYGVVATWQTSNFARVYATYGGVFIAASLLWAMKFDNYKPDVYDIMGALTALFGVGVIYFAPRT